MMHISHDQRIGCTILAHTQRTFSAVPFYNYNSRFLEIDTLTKSAIIQWQMAYYPLLKLYKISLKISSIMLKIGGLYTT